MCPIYAWRPAKLIVHSRLPAALLCSACLHLLVVMALLMLRHGSLAGIHPTGTTSTTTATRSGIALLLQRTPPIRNPPPSPMPVTAAAVETAVTPAMATRSENVHREPQAEEFRYVPDALLSKLPVPLDGIDLHVPALDGRIEREPVKLTLRIDAHGKVTDIRLANGAGGSKRDTEILLELAKRFANLRFSPGEIDGFPVNAELHIVIATDDEAPSANPSPP